MKKFFLSLLFVLCISFAVNAQYIREKDYSINVGVDLAYAVGRFHYAHTLGYGLFVQGEYLFADNSAATVGTGYITFPNKTFTDSISADIVTEQLNQFTMVPFLIGIKVDNENKYYIHPQVGVAFRSNPFVSACYAFAVGIKSSKHSDFSFRYEAVHKKSVVASYFAIRAAYVF